jgi:hypothetical protein
MKFKSTLAALVSLSVLAIPATFAADESCDKPKKTEESEGCKIPKGSLTLPANFLKKKNAAVKPSAKPAPKTSSR